MRHRYAADTDRDSVEPMLRMSARRKFLTAGISAGAALLSFGCGSGSVSGNERDDERAALLVALNVEYLLAEAYGWALSGASKLDDSDKDGTGNRGFTVGGAKVTFDAAVQPIIEQVASDQILHVRTLRNVLGQDTPAKASIKLASLGFGFASATEFFQLARVLQDFATSMYGGAQASMVLAARKSLIGGLLGAECSYGAELRRLALNAGGAQRSWPSDDVAPTAGHLFNTTNGLIPSRDRGAVTAALATGDTPFFQFGLNL